MFRFRAFRAIDEPETCRNFIKEHKKVLREFGVTNLASADDDWMYWPTVYVVVAEIQGSGELVSGARIHLVHPDYPLPMEKALVKQDEKIAAMVKHYSKRLTAEVGAFWCSKSSGFPGLASQFLSRAALVTAWQLEIEHLLAVVAPYTLSTTLKNGFEIEKRVGNNGKFMYPRKDILSTTVVLKDLEKLSLAREEEREAVFQLRENPDQLKIEWSSRRVLLNEYQLDIKTLVPI